MKKFISSIALCLLVSTTFPQTPKELITKMKQSIIKLKSLEAEILEHSLYYPDREFNYNRSLSLVYDTNTLKKPGFQKAKLSSFLLNTDKPKSNCQLLNNKENIEIDDLKKVIYIEEINRKNKKDFIVDITENSFPYFNYISLIYLDSLQDKNFKSESMDMSKVVYEVLSDTACLSGDCYLLKITAPSFYGTEVKAGAKDSSRTVNFKMEILSFWINKHNFFPERFSRVWTLDDNSQAIYKDYRFTKINVNPKIDDAVFSFKILSYKYYRIVKVTAKGNKIIQDAAKK